MSKSPTRPPKTWQIMSFGLLMLASCHGRSSERIAIPLVRLLVLPDDLIGENVRVSGFLDKKVGLRLYLTQEHARMSDFASSVAVADDTEDGSLTLSPCTDNHVDVIGVVGMRAKLDPQIVDVQRVLTNTKDPGVCWARSGERRQDE